MEGYSHIGGWISYPLIELAGPNFRGDPQLFDPGLDFDLLMVNGIADISGTLKFSLYNGFVPSGGHSFTFLVADVINLGPSIAYSFADASLNGFHFMVVQDSGCGDNQQALTLYIPEPAPLGLMLIGLLGAGLRRHPMLTGKVVVA